MWPHEPLTRGSLPISIPVYVLNKPREMPIGAI